MASTSFIKSTNPAMAGLEAALSGVAGTDLPVLIVGETGTGKRALCERLHGLSKRKTQAFRVLNCARLTSEHFENGTAELGGFWEAAEIAASGVGPGTLLLKEVADLSPECQLKLRDALSAHHGNGVPRFVASTYRDLQAEIKAGRFREDLYYRLSAVCLAVPPLRQRREDIPALFDHFLSAYSAVFGMRKPQLSAEFTFMVGNYDWPGNLRELEAIAKLAVTGGEQAALVPLQKPTVVAADGESVSVSLKRVARAASLHAQRDLILQALSKTRWNRKRAAEQLQISYKALLYKMREVGLVSMSGQTE